MEEASTTEYIIKPPGRFSLNFKELWQYRELFYFFIWRDIKVKYKQTILGFLWAILQPLLMMFVFIFFFSNTLSVPTDGIPPPIFYFSGLLLWNIFSSGVNNAGNSMISNANIIKKIYFPRLIIPLSSVLTCVFDFLMALVVFISLVIYYQINGYTFSLIKLLIFLPLGLLLTVITTFGFGCLIASLNIKYRDFRYVIPFLIQFAFFITPVIYPISIFNNSWLENILSLNPIAGAISLGRAAFLDINVDWLEIGISTCASIFIFFIGIFNFRKTEVYFADLA
jgi:lipopolysaccharide transport system permease protein